MCYTIGHSAYYAKMNLDSSVINNSSNDGTPVSTPSSRQAAIDRYIITMFSELHSLLISYISVEFARKEQQRPVEESLSPIPRPVALHPRRLVERAETLPTHLL